MAYDNNNSKMALYFCRFRLIRSNYISNAISFTTKHERVEILGIEKNLALQSRLRIRAQRFRWPKILRLYWMRPMVRILPPFQIRLACILFWSDDLLHSFNNYASKWNLRICRLYKICYPIKWKFRPFNATSRTQSLVNNLRYQQS